MPIVPAYTGVVKYIKLTSAHNWPPAEANIGERKISGDTPEAPGNAQRLRPTCWGHVSNAAPLAFLLSEWISALNEASPQVHLGACFVRAVCGRHV